LFFSITISSNSPCNFFEWFNKIKLINYDNGINLIWFICFDLKIQSRVEHIADLVRAEPVRRTKVKVIALCLWLSICVLAILWFDAFLVLMFLLNWTNYCYCVEQDMSAEVVDSNPYSRLMALQRMGIVENYERIRNFSIAIVVCTNLLSYLYLLPYNNICDCDMMCMLIDVWVTLMMQA
jgi:hypothetical protein